MTASRSYSTDHGIFGSPGDVTPRDIRFEPTDPAYLERTATSAWTWRVHTEPGLTDAQLVTRDQSGVVAYPMRLASEGIRFLIWEATLDIAEPTEFTFAFRTVGGLPVYRVPAGVSNAVERLDRWQLDLTQEAFTTPAWAHGALMYQIFPDRFSNGDPTNDPAEVAPWNQAPTSRGFWGGDLVGITNRLDYLQNMGIDLLYLNPIFVSPSNHRYDTTDYYAVDPMLGGNDAFRTLIDQAHQRQIRVIIDASFNHVHPTFFAFQDLLANGPNSLYAEWFQVAEWPLRLKHRPHLIKQAPWVADWLPVWEDEIGIPVEDVTDDGPVVEPTYDSWYGVATMPRVDLSHPAARQYMLDVADHWIREFGIDGWRMDVARYVDPDFWDDFRKITKAANPDVLLICEVMGDASPWLQGNRFDGTMNYSFRDLALGFFAHEDIDGGEFLDRSTAVFGQYAQAATAVGQNLIGSHDTPRFRTEAGGDQWRLDLATVWQLTSPGIPSVYYGDETGLAGANDPGCRGTIEWADAPEQHPTYRLIAELAGLRRRRQALTRGEWHPGPYKTHIVSYERKQGRSRVLVVLNRSRTKQHITNQGWRTTLWGNATITDETITLPGRSAAVIGR